MWYISVFEWSLGVLDFFAFLFSSNLERAGISLMCLLTVQEYDQKGW